MLVPDFTTVVSSANKIGVEHFTELGKSLIYSRNNKGPSTDPCGTPILTVLHTDLVPFISTSWDLSVKYDLNQLLFQSFCVPYIFYILHLK